MLKNFLFHVTKMLHILNILYCDIRNNLSNEMESINLNAGYWK